MSVPNLKWMALFVHKLLGGPKIGGTRKKKVNGLRPIHTHTLLENENAAGKLTAVLRFTY